jgi:hypothetical protein
MAADSFMSAPLDLDTALYAKADETRNPDLTPPAYPGQMAPPVGIPVATGPQRAPSTGYAPSFPPVATGPQGVAPMPMGAVPMAAVPAPVPMGLAPTMAAMNAPATGPASGPSSSPFTGIPADPVLAQSIAPIPQSAPPIVAPSLQTAVPKSSIPAPKPAASTGLTYSPAPPIASVAPGPVPMGVAPPLNIAARKGDFGPIGAPSIPTVASPAAPAALPGALAPAAAAPSAAALENPNSDEIAAMLGSPQQFTKTAPLQMTVPSAMSPNTLFGAPDEYTFPDGAPAPMSLAPPAASNVAAAPAVAPSVAPAGVSAQPVNAAPTQAPSAPAASPSIPTIGGTSPSSIPTVQAPEMQQQLDAPQTSAAAARVGFGGLDAKPDPQHRGWGAPMGVSDLIAIAAAPLTGGMSLAGPALSRTAGSVANLFGGVPQQSAVSSWGSPGPVDYAMMAGTNYDGTVDPVAAWNAFNSQPGSSYGPNVAQMNYAMGNQAGSGLHDMSTVATGAMNSGMAGLY